MPRLNIYRRDGALLEIGAAEGQTLMQALRDGGVDEILALCGGACSCATCHVYVGADFHHQFPPIGPDEAALLDASSHLTPLSRLSCQLRVTADWEGTKIWIAPED